MFKGNNLNILAFKIKDGPILALPDSKIILLVVPFYLLDVKNG
jgi:hypothetical protein